MGLISGGGAAPLTSFVTITPTQVRAARSVAITLIPAPGAGFAIADASLVFVFGAGFATYGAAFATDIGLGDLLLGSSSWHTGTVASQALTDGLKGGLPNDLVGLWFGAAVQAGETTQGIWSGPLSQLENRALQLIAFTADPTGGAGNIVCSSAYTVIRVA